jgi:ParB/RepB/Spo0J family partition protein
MLISVNKIRDRANVRQIPAGVEADAGLLASVRSQGVLQPILVQRLGQDAYSLIFGRRRLNAAREAGLTEIPAEVREMTDGQVLSAQAAENMARAGMHPVDQWRAVRAMMENGLTALDAAAALGLEERRARRMERLGMLHPEILELIEEMGFPSDHELRKIAVVSLERQAAALKVPGAFRRQNGVAVEITWWKIAQACEDQRIYRPAAIFDPALLAWDVDLFAQPGAQDEYSTTDREAFRELQVAALEARVAAAQAKKKRLRLSTWDSATHGPKVPAGFKRTYGDVDKPKRVETVFTCLDEKLNVASVTAEDLAAVKQAEAKKNKGTGVAGGDDPDEGDDIPWKPLVEVLKPRISKAGLAMIADAKTQALRETLRDGLAGETPHRVLTLMMLAFTALNVSCSGVEEPDSLVWSMRRFRDLAARVLTPEGEVLPLSLADVRMHAGELLARLLSFGTPGPAGSCSDTSGPAAEWIGAAIGAEQALPRFDTEEFLQHVGGDELRRMAGAEGKKTTGTVKVVRERLVGQLPDWRPEGAEFGAPAPQGREHGA